MEKSEQNYNMLDWWKKVHLQNYANFNGRARRAEYWYAYLLNIIIFLPIYILFIIAAVNESQVMMMVTGALMLVMGLALIVPYLAVAARRLHDTNRSGWFLLLSLVPFVSIIVFVFTVLEGTKGENDFGKDPKDFTNHDELNQIGAE
jgi:uncharacterized membrane protein YhaH (DUF805 family)